MEERDHFTQSVQAQMEIYGSMFGMATVNLSSPKVSGHGSISNCHPGVYLGTFYFTNDLVLKKVRQYRLECSIVDKVFSAAFFPRASHEVLDQHGLFVTEISEGDQFFHGVFEFS